MTCSLKTFAPAAMACVALLYSAPSAFASVNLVTNGTFDADLAGWSIDEGATTWDPSQTAHLGRSGQEMTSVFSQSFDIPSSAAALLIEFDYEWQVNAPSTADNFLAELVYNTISGTETVELINEFSTTAAFNSTVVFSAVVSLVDLLDSADNGTIRYTLIETENMPASAGTRVALDNVAVHAVPEATSVLVWSALCGVGLIRTRRGSRG